MKKLLSAIALFICVSAAFPSDSHAQALQFYSLADLKTLFVDRQEGFIFTNEGFPENSAGRSLKIIALDTTSGVFAGTLTGTSITYQNGSNTQGVSGTIHLGATHGGTWAWIEFGYSFSLAGGGITQTQTFAAGTTLSGVGTYAPSGFIAGFQSEQERNFTGGWSWKNQPFSGILAVLP